MGTEIEVVKKDDTKPGIQFDKNLRSDLEVYLTEEEIKLLEVFRHVFYGDISLHKKAGKLDGRIHFRETY